jgi:hypothetical protein
VPSYRTAFTASHASPQGSGEVNKSARDLSQLRPHLQVWLLQCGLAVRPDKSWPRPAFLLLEPK